MTAKARKRWLITVGVVAVVAAMLLHYKERDSYRCQSCWARKDVVQWKIGAWLLFSVPVTPSWERITEIRFRQDFLPPDHVHDWMFAQGSPYHFFGTTWGGCAIGGGRYVSELFQMYEAAPEFRSFISQKVRDGSFAKSNVVALMSIPRTVEPSPLQKDADALLEAFYSK